MIFIVGLPRSGSTLFEQILAAHPQVEGAGELPDLGIVLQQESLRRGRPYPQWVAEASAADWDRLGRDYLARTARWRSQRPRFTDKHPDNWKHAGVLRAMLPGASRGRNPARAAGNRVVLLQAAVLRATALRQRPGRHRLLPARLRAGDGRPGARATRQRIFLHRYETLLEDPEPAIRALLRDCGLAFDPACLSPHRATRSVRTASAAQVRQPLRAGTARAVAYGSLLDPLVSLLGPLLA